MGYHSKKGKQQLCLCLKTISGKLEWQSISIALLRQKLPPEKKLQKLLLQKTEYFIPTSERNSDAVEWSLYGRDNFIWKLVADQNIRVLGEIGYYTNNEAIMHLFNIVNPFVVLAPSVMVLHNNNRAASPFSVKMFYLEQANSPVKEYLVGEKWPDLLGLTIYHLDELICM